MWVYDPVIREVLAIQLGECHELGVDDDGEYHKVEDLAHL